MKRADETSVDLSDEEALALQESALVDEPGTVAPGQTIHKPDIGNPMPSTVSEITSAGYALVYDRLTGDPSVVNRNMLATKLRQKRADGTPVFTLQDPGFRPPMGSIKCVLHAEQAERSEWDKLGFAVCKKANLKTPYDQLRHMQRRHPTEWAAINDQRSRTEREKWESERQEDRLFQRRLMEMLIEREESVERRQNSE